MGVSYADSLMRGGICLKIAPTLTPTMLRTRYHERGGAPAKPSRPNSALPALAPETDEDASDDWLVHVQAGRIAVR